MGYGGVGEILCTVGVGRIGYRGSVGSKEGLGVEKWG